jgi:hypothetical protein
VRASIPKLAPALKRIATRTFQLPKRGFLLLFCFLLLLFLVLLLPEPLSLPPPFLSVSSCRWWMQVYRFECFFASVGCLLGLPLLCVAHHFPVLSLIFVVAQVQVARLHSQYFVINEGGEDAS